MKVNDISKISGVYESKTLGNRQPYRAKAESKSDELSLSKDAKDFQAVMKGLREASDIREDRIREVSAKINDPGYRPDYMEMADRMLNSGILVSKK